MKTTKNNYIERLSEIAAEFDLQEVATVSEYNGYPAGIIPLLVGLESEEQALAIREKYEDVKFFELQTKEGWNTYYRLNSWVEPYSYEADNDWDDSVSALWRKSDKLDDLEIYYLGEGLQYEAECLISDCADFGLTLDKPASPYSECGIKEYEAFLDAAEELIYEDESGDDLSCLLRSIAEMRKTVNWVKEFRSEFNSLKANEVLVIENNWSTRRIKEKSMSWYDGDVTYRCIAVGFDPSLLSDENEDEE